jgi:hypothetical protein
MPLHFSNKQEFARSIHVAPVVRADLLKNSSLPPDQTVAQKKALEAEKVQEITYQVERTDDGKNVYVTPISFGNVVAVASPVGSS